MQHAEILELFEDLRVADVRDGMDWAGLHDKGTASAEIGPLGQGMRLCGIARTVRMQPAVEAAPRVEPEEYERFWKAWWRDHFDLGLDRIESGDVVVIDSDGLDVGNVGSDNSLKWHADGAVGVVTNGGVRDIDELVRQGVPIFNRYRAMKVPHGRSEVAARQVPVDIGGALVRPGDVVIADADGVLVVPIERAAEVARHARREHEQDKAKRRASYERLGWEPDETV